ncbi:hypothetical protein F2Q69_00058368 [Brassica cretica]|uniref:Protein DA1-like domain-containing protein n=1 Tax=Brassica cretica TaxID=69181 RepID=A0A8S9RQN7_BRACR|nr:hypothetical protein F2Q69_00058368 [Brassica cretica]
MECRFGPPKREGGRKLIVLRVGSRTGCLLGRITNMEEGERLVYLISSRKSVAERDGYRNLNNILEEGICQVLGHMWLESQTYATIDASSASSSSPSQPPGGANASKKGEWSEFEKKLVEFCKNEIETDESAVYGEGFRKVNHMVTNSNLYETLQEILRRRG